MHMQTYGCSALVITLAACCATFSARSQTADSFVAPQLDRSIYCLAVQADGKVIIGGDFNNVGGVSRPGFARLNPDGTLDPSFTPAFPIGYCLTIQPDGKIVVSSGTSVARFNTDGTLHDRASLDIDYEVRCLAVQADGKVLMGGFLKTVANQARTNIARLNADWTLDTNFNGWVNSEVFCVAQQENGQLVIGGNFTVCNGQPRSRICRLNPDGTLDRTFSASASDTVYALAIESDGKIVVGGYFTNLDGQSRTGVGRLNQDGTLDANFNSDIVDPHVVLSLALQTDGRIIVGGLFGTLHGAGANLCRLNFDGSEDTNFNAQVNPSYDEVDQVVVQSDGKVVATGSFAGLGGMPRQYIGRLNNTEPATKNLSFDGSAITWGRGGTSPEVWRTHFALSLDQGKTWTSLGEGTRVGGGWRLGGLSLPLNATLRARGYTANSFVEALLGAPLVMEPPLSTTNDAGTTATFMVYSGGTEPLSYHWRKNGAALTDAIHVTGASTRTLIVSNTLGADAGNYAVVISNSFGSVTSAVATLTIRDPVVSVQPASVTRQFGEDASFSVGVVGTPPFTYQWRRNGTPIIGASQASLLLTNLQATDAAVYDAVVGTSWGSLTSKLALLTINLVSPDSFDPKAIGRWDGTVSGLVVQPDARILVNGSFDSIAGHNYTNLARLNPDGTLDGNFNPGAYGFNGGGPLMLMPDGKIIAGGNSLARLNPDGTPDAILSLAAAGSLLLLPDGKFLAADYPNVNGNPTVFRFNADGKVDPTFTPGAYNAIPKGYITMAAQPDGELVGGGYYTVYSEVDEDFAFLVRVDAQGKPDTNFNAAVNLNYAVNTDGSHVETVAIQADGKILVGGSFSRIGGQYRTNFARLNPDGTADLSFHPNPDGSVTSIALQANGKLVVGGWFTMIGGESRTNLARLYPDGTIDPTFNPWLDPTEYYPSTAVALQSDGKILVSGQFTNLAGQPRINLGRLNNNDPSTQSFTLDGSVLHWYRGGSSPEVWATTFAYTTNGGSSWTELGRGTRISGGWQLTGVAAPSGAAFRALGYLTAGLGNSCSSVVESFTGPPGFYTEPVSITRNAGTTADLYVHAGGTGPTAFHWRKDGKDLFDGVNVSGALTDHLTLTSLLSANSGGYSAAFTYAGGTVASSVATLTVIDPAINIQPLDQITNIGCTLALEPSAAGTPPLYYQWWKDGVVQQGATRQSLLVTNLQLSDAGKYLLLVSNTLGIAISTAAVVVVHAPAADSFNPGTDAPVGCLALQPDGRILAADGYGSFERLMPDGTPDPSFRSYYSEGADTVDSLTVLPDGKILAAGSFNTISGQNRNQVAQFYPDGTIDSFNPNYLAGTVYTVLSQPDGKLIVGGYFSTSPQNIGNALARFNADGTLDSSFDPAMPEGSAIVRCLMYQPDGKILVAGGFTSIAGQARTNLARLNPDGTLDASFDPALEDPVTSLVTQSDGRILVATTSASVFQTRCSLKRLNPNGTLDTSFSTVFENYSTVTAIALQTDGRILIGGHFNTVDGQSWGNLARLNPDGSLDVAFNPQVAGTYPSAVDSLAIQPDGKILVGGSFSTLAGQPRTNIGRLENNVPATQSLSFDASTIIWLRGGGTPEIFRASFQFSIDGTTWVSLGDGARIPGGWTLSGVRLPELSVLRARGFIQNGTGSWFVESSVVVGSGGRPLIFPDSSSGLAAGSFGFNIVGTSGQVVVVDTSEDLVNWSPLNTLTLGSAPQHFTDATAPTAHSKFYRLRLAQ